MIFKEFKIKAFIAVSDVQDVQEGPISELGRVTTSGGGGWWLRGKHFKMKYL